MGEWKTIDTAPKDGRKIVIANGKWDIMPVAYWDDTPFGNGVVGWTFQRN